MTFMTPRLRFLMILISICTLVGGVGCSSLKKMQKEAGMRSQSIKLADLGKSYVTLQDTDYNFFKATERPIRVKYKTFKLTKFDTMTKRANILYAKFKFAQRAQHQFDLLVDEALKTGFKGESRKSLRKAIKRKSAHQIKSTERLGKSYDALKLSLDACREMVDEAKKLSDSSEELTSNTIKTIKNKPDKVILTDQVLSESKQSLSRLQEVVKGAPKLVKSLATSVEIAQVAQSVKR